MNNIPPKLRDELAHDPYYTVCALKKLFNHRCEGRITWEHALIFAGKQVQARFAIVPLCEKAHSVNNFQDGGELNKERNVWVALNRGSDEELLAISKSTDYFLERHRLNKLFRMVYKEPVFAPREMIEY